MLLYSNFVKKACLAFVMVVAVTAVSCNHKKIKTHKFSSVSIYPIVSGDTVNIRTLELMSDNRIVAFAGGKGLYGTYDTQTNTLRTNTQTYDTLNLEFRATAHTASDFFMLSVANPALLYKTADEGGMQVVYKEEGDQVFYDSMKFWNDKEGIAVGDPMGGCASIIITRDGGNTWKKLTCDQLPEIQEGEAFFAASNTNIAVYGDDTWIASGGSRSAILYSPDKGKTWSLRTTPFMAGNEGAGIFSIDFYDDLNGFAVGGNFMEVEADTANKAITADGGKTWKVVGDNSGVGYKSCVQYVPNGNANELVALGKTGIVYSNNAGKTWKKLSDESFFTFRFVDDSTAYAAGYTSIAKLKFK